MHTSPSEVREIMPPAWRRPSVLLWIYLLPQLVLLGLNAQSYHLVAGEMSPEQRGHAFTIAGYALALLLGVGCLWAVSRRRGWTLHWALALPLLAAHVGYLWMFVAWLDLLIPSTVVWWMLPPERLLYHQFALIMPAIFHAALILACFPTRLSTRCDLLRTGLLLVVVPAAWYVVAHVAFRLRHMTFDVPEVVVFLLIVLSTLLLTGALLRILAAGWQAIRRAGGHGRLVLIALVGLAGPLGGLTLNMKIPFPVDFQSMAVYVLAVLNGLVLLLPGSGPKAGHRLVWLTQCAAFPFTLYFFLVFLPFLPLSLLAIIAAGAGFLMLVPTALCLVHISILRDGWPMAGRGWRVAGMLALLVLPGLFAARAWQDRTALNQGLAYLYEPTAAADRFPGNVKAVGRSLRNLRDFKSGLQLPFLSEFYSQMVFGGLALPEARMQDMHRAFFGCDLEPPDETRMTDPFLGERRNLTRWGATRTPDELPHSVELSALRSDETTEGDIKRLLVTLQLVNHGDSGAEYGAPITIPPGTWISGFWLHIGKERVPGRLFEKKTALWVYEMIRDQTQRDPGLLLYRAPGIVELRVFPFAAGETRTVEVEFVYPTGFGSMIHIGSSYVAPPVAQPGGSVAGVTDPEGDHLRVVAPSAWANLPVTNRSAYLHAIVDHSAAASVAGEAWPQIEAAARQLGVERCAVSLVNYENITLTGAPVPLNEAKAMLAAAASPACGGFCRDRALKSVLKQWYQQEPQSVPVLLVISSSTNALAQDADLAWFASRWPGLDGYYVVGEEGGLQAVDWAGKAREEKGPIEWTSLKVAGQTHWIPAAEARPVVLTDDAPGADSVTIITNETYRQGAEAWLDSHRRWGGAAVDLRALVEASRVSGVLVPATSYIVVENSAQWRFLEQSERQKLGQNAALEFRDSPEPSVWLLAGGFLAWLWWRKKMPLAERLLHSGSRVVAPP